MVFCWVSASLQPSLRPYKLNEMTRRDKYIDPYWGKDYQGKPREVMSMAMQTVLSGDKFMELYADDRKMLDFVVGLLFNWKP
jgi:hypothetical protein